VEIEAICFLATVLSVDSRFSLVRTARASKGRFSRKRLAKLLRKYATVQDQVLEALARQAVNLAGRRRRFFIAVDDTLIQKRGKKIFGSRRWYNHGVHQTVRALCLVDLALVVNGEALFVLPYLLQKSLVRCRIVSNNQSKASREQDAKTIAAMGLIRRIVRWLEEEGIARSKIGVLADAWFSNQTFLAFLREMKLIFRVDGKKNYSVQEPDFKRIARRNNGGRGRKPKQFVKQRRLDAYFETVQAAGIFQDTTTGKAVRWKVALVTLKSGGRVRVVTFWRESCTHPKYILTLATYKSQPNPRTVYYEYSWRWRIEEAHRDLKQQFGLGKGRVRGEAAVQGFLSLVYSIYSLFLMTRQKGEVSSPERMTAPQYQDAAVEFLYCNQGVILR